MGRSSGSSSSSSSASTAARQAAARDAAFSGNTGRPTGLGITTGKTMYGNTAIGPAGGAATAYATRSPGSVPSPNQGTGLTGGTFSNFRTPSGGAMFSGGLQSQPVAARNASQALQMLQAMQAAQARPTPAGGPRAPGLLDEELPINAVPGIPAIPPNMPPQNWPWANPAIMDMKGYMGWPSRFTGPNFYNKWPNGPRFDPNDGRYVVGNQTEYKTPGKTDFQGGNVPIGQSSPKPSFGYGR